MAGDETQFAFRQNNCRRAFAEAQADARLVEWAATFRIERFQRVETGQDELRNQIHAGDENHIGESAPDERRALLERAQAGNARGGNALHRAATIKRLREIGGEKCGLNLPLRHGGNGLLADKFVQCFDVGLGRRKDESAPLRRERNPEWSPAFSAASRNAAAAKRKARESACAASAARSCATISSGNKTGDDGLAGFADESFRGATRRWRSPPRRVAARSESH